MPRHQVSSEWGGHGPNKRTVPMRVSASILIQRPIAEVFSFVSNPGYLPSWVAGVTTADGLLQLDQGVGETLVLQCIPSLGLAASTWEVTSYEPPRMLALRCLDDRRAIETRWTLEGSRLGATRVSVEADLTAVGFFPPASVHLKDLGTRQLEVDLELLRSHLEAEARGDTC
jgi:uncharacterized protein YndB with AHSA1/START domain